MSFDHDNNDFSEVWNWFGKRRIFFSKEENGRVENSIRIMLNCFEVLYYYSGSIIFKLKENAKQFGLFDIKNKLEFDEDIDDDELGVIYTHNHYGKEKETVKLSKVIQRDQWNHVLCQLNERNWYDTDFDRPTDRELIDNL